MLHARSTDKQIQKIAQDGGIVSALLCFALDEKIIDGAVVAGPSDVMWKPEPMVAMSSDEILAAAGTKYTYITKLCGCLKKQLDNTDWKKSVQSPYPVKPWVLEKCSPTHSE